MEGALPSSDRPMVPSANALGRHCTDRAADGGGVAEHAGLWSEMCHGIRVFSIAVGGGGSGIGLPLLGMGDNPPLSAVI